MLAADRTTDPATYPTARRVSRWIAWVLFALLSILSLPSAFTTLADDPDSGWRWGLNQLAQRHSNAPPVEAPPVFPLGPLGYLERPDLPNFAPAATAQAALHLLLCGAFVVLLRQRGAATIAATTAVLFLVWVARAPDGLPLVVAWLWIGFVFDDSSASPRRRASALCAWIALATVLTAIRPTSAAILLALAFSAWTARRFRPPTLATSGWVAAGATALLGGLFFTRFFSSIPALLAWARDVLTLSSQHSIAMSLAETSGGVLATGLGLGLALGVLLLVEARHSEAHRALLVSALPLLWFAFKHGFHRQDAHVLIFFSVAALIATGLAIFTPEPRHRLAWGLALASGVTLWSLDPLVREGGPSNGATAISILSGERLSRTVRDWRACAWKPCASAWRRTSPQASPIPVDWLDAQDALGSVDVVPYRLQRLFRPPELGTRWRASPTLQLPMAMTPALDDLVARHFAERGPDRLIAEVAAIDGRAMFWDTPATWRAIQSWYRLREAGPRWLWLERREEPRNWTFDAPVPLAVLNDTIEIPAVDNQTWPLVEIDFRLTWWGRLRNLLLRVEPVFVDYESRGGRSGRQRLIAANASQGLLATQPPANGEDLARLLGEYRGRPIERMRLSGDGLSSYEILGARLIPAHLVDGAP